MLNKKDLKILPVIKKVYFDLVVKGSWEEFCRSVRDK
jgi:hypothetical protein